MRSEGERRGNPRLPGTAADALRGMRLRTGHPVRLLDVSRAGASIETSARLAPGSPVDVVAVLGDRTVAARSVVVYARVCRLHPTNGTTYRIGLSVPPGQDRRWWPVE